jgi:hypothetical protein
MAILAFLLMKKKILKRQQSRDRLKSASLKRDRIEKCCRYIENDFFFFSVVDGFEPV